MSVIESTLYHNPKTDERFVIGSPQRDTLTQASREVLGVVHDAYQDMYLAGPERRFVKMHDPPLTPQDLSLYVPENNPYTVEIMRAKLVEEIRAKEIARLVVAPIIEQEDAGHTGSISGTGVFTCDPEGEYAGDVSQVCIARDLRRKHIATALVHRGLMEIYENSGGGDDATVKAEFPDGHYVAKGWLLRLGFEEKRFFVRSKVFPSSPAPRLWVQTEASIGKVIDKIEDDHPWIGAAKIL